MITVYEKPTCSTCRNLVMLLKERGIDFERINYIIDPLGKPELQELLRMLRVPARELLRTKEPEYEALGLKDATEERILDAIAAHPRLMQRPVVVMGTQAVIARPPERVLEMLPNG